MLEKITYPNINAKLKGMYAKTLSQEDLEDLLKQKTIKDAIIILKSKLKPLEDLKINATRIELESELDNLIISDIENIIVSLEVLKDDLKTFVSTSNDKELTERVKSMRKDNICIDDIAIFNNISVREVIDILDL